MLRDCSGDKGRELHHSFKFRSVPRTPLVYDRYPKAARYGPAGRSFPSGTAAPLESAAEAKRRARPRAEAPRGQFPAVPPLPAAHPWGPRAAGARCPQPRSCPRGPAPVPRRLSGSTRPRGQPRFAQPALPGWRAEQSGDGERKTGRKYGSRRLPALCLDLAA